MSLNITYGHRPHYSRNRHLIAKVNPDIETNLYRTAELSPGKYYYQIPDEDKDAVVADLVAKRSAMLGAANVDLIPVERLAEYGRVMFFEANETLVDGAPEFESGYYIDSGDAPPWDTWIATERQLFIIDFWAHKLHLTDKLLVGWVPKSQYFYAQQAINVACIDNFEWPESYCVADRFNELKSLFAKPPIISEPLQVIDYSSRQQLSKLVMQEAEAHSEIYYQERDKSYTKTVNSVALKQPFWKRLLNRK